MINANELLDWIQERKMWLSRFWWTEKSIRELEIIEKKIHEMTDSGEKFDINIFDQCEEFENCTVQVLTNTVTGEVSVGWWQDSAEEIRL